MGVSNSIDSFFVDQAQFGRLRDPTTIVLLVGIAWALQPVAIYYSLDPNVRLYVQNAIAMDALVRFLVPTLLWLYFWISFAVLASFFGARMRLGRLFKLVGWGLLPLIGSALVRAVGRYYTFQGSALTMEVRRGVMAREFEAYSSLIEVNLGNPALVWSTLVGSLFVLLSAYLWIYAVKASTDLDPRKIYLVVIIPTALYIVFSIVNVFSSIGYL